MFLFKKANWGCFCIYGDLKTCLLCIWQIFWRVCSNKVYCIRVDSWLHLLSLNHLFFACKSHLLVFSTHRKDRNERPRNLLAVPSGFRDVSGIMYVSCIIHYDFEKTIFNIWFLYSYLRNWNILPVRHLVNCWPFFLILRPSLSYTSISNYSTRLKCCEAGLLFFFTKSSGAEKIIL